MPMPLMPVLGALILLLVCPLIGGMPLIAWITRGLSGKQLSELGTGNISVSAAFYHGGKASGILAVLSEMAKGIAAVLLARMIFPGEPSWELVALIALVVGRFLIGRGAGTTNVVWGYVVHDWRVALLTFVIGGAGFTLIRERRQGRIAVLILFPLMTVLLHPQDAARGIAAIALGALMGWIYTQIPDDLDLDPTSGQRDTQTMFRFFRGDRALISLNQPLESAKVGSKAATLSQLKFWGYPVPMGWVLPPGDDPEPLITFLQPSPENPLVVRSSAIGEDSEQASAAGQYETILHVTSREALQQAIVQCLSSYDQPAAVQYRRDRGMPEDAIAVLVQVQVPGVFSGVAFSRDPLARQGDAVVIEALPGAASLVVSGQTTPEQYQVWIPDAAIPTAETDWLLPEDLNLTMEGTGDVPPRLIQQVAFLARHLETRYHGIPQDIEWTYDGQTLWLLQSRPITTLLPIWTRKIAAEVIPGIIRPLTWSINRPLTCGVWGELFTVVLGDRARGLDFTETATLHYGRAYFNASLLGQLFRRMGLPPESLEFLTRGAKFSKPPLRSTLRNGPGLWRLLTREFRLEADFERDDRLHFSPLLDSLTRQPATDLSAIALLQRIEHILDALEGATYYSILAPLSASLRQGILRVPDSDIDNGKTPEVAALRELQAIARAARQRIPDMPPPNPSNTNGESDRSLITSALFAHLSEHPEGQSIFGQLEQFLANYGYLSEVGTDIAVPTWQEDPHAVRELFAQFFLNPPPEPAPANIGKGERVQRRIDLKGQVTAVYSRLLAELRWSFVALEAQWLQSRFLKQPGDIFYLEFSEIQRLITHPERSTPAQVSEWIAARREQRSQHSSLNPVPNLVYGPSSPVPLQRRTWQPSQQLHGIGASPGQVEGRIKVLRSLQNVGEISPDTILVVPYTDSGWAPLLARAAGLIAEVGGRLSHGAIVAREYRIPAVMDIADATHQLQDGQWVRLDGAKGTVEIL